VAKGHSLFSLSTLLASFFGAAMIAAAFAYFNYKFSEYKFIDFKEWIFYEKRDIFTPQKEKYIVVFYSSKENNAQERLSTLDLNIPIVAIDYYNGAYENTPNIPLFYAVERRTLSPLFSALISMKYHLFFL
jgi:hypothetical protein